MSIQAREERLGKIPLTGKCEKETHATENTTTVTTCGSDNLKGVLDTMQKLQKYANSALLPAAVSNRLKSYVCVVLNGLHTERGELKPLCSF